jgi:hypothetical protein
LVESKYLPSTREYKTCIFVVFLCAACLPASLIMHVPVSELNAQCHSCLHFSIRLNSQRFIQFHPTVMLVAYVNSWFIILPQTSFLFLFLAESAKILVRPRTCFPSAEIFFFYSAVWLEQQSADWHVAPLGHIILIRRSLYIAMILIRPYTQTSHLITQCWVTICKLSHKWFRSHQSLLFLLNVACLAEKQQIPIV